MGSYADCENCTDFENTPINKSNKENDEIIRNDSYISFHQETNLPKLAENNINNIINISKHSEEVEKKEGKEGGSKINEENKEDNNNINSIENARIPKKEMPSNKNENKTRNIVNELIELNNNENNININHNNDNIDTININDNKNEVENEKINNKDIIIDNISHKSEESEDKQIDNNNIQKENLIMNNNINNNKKSSTELNIYNFISKNKLEQLQDNSILCNGFLEKIIKIPSKNKFIYNERYL